MPVYISPNSMAQIQIIKKFLFTRTSHKLQLIESFDWFRSITELFRANESICRGLRESGSGFCCRA